MYTISRAAARMRAGTQALPADRMAALRVAAAQQRGAVLLVGPRGSGKSMAAQVLASQLGLGLMRVDLARVVSRYIGETEKNLDRLFSVASGSGALLFFDEADALFGQRTGVRDSHDRYANLEVSHLLQRVERHPSLVVLATQRRVGIDPAILRRLRHVVELPGPPPRG